MSFPSLVFLARVDHSLPYLSTKNSAQSWRRPLMNSLHPNFLNAEYVWSRSPSWLVPALKPKPWSMRQFHKCSGTSASSALTALVYCFASLIFLKDSLWAILCCFSSLILRIVSCCASICTPNDPLFKRVCLRTSNSGTAVVCLANGIRVTVKVEVSITSPTASCKT